MIPGAPEIAEREKRSRTGITVDRAIWERIVAVAIERQVDLSSFQDLAGPQVAEAS
jgi:LDH2 family malate/lactate/ureidoglycolate dehydrogenase